MRMILVMICLFIAYRGIGQPMPVELKPLNDYFYIGKGSDLKPGVNCIIISDKKKFIKMFGNIVRPDTPDFKNEVMLVLILPQTRHEAKLSFRKAGTKAGTFVEVYCNAEMNIRPLTYKYYPLAACTLHRYPGIHKLNFYEGEKLKLLASLELK